MRVLRAAFGWVGSVFGHVNDSVHGLINGEELVRAILAAISAGFTVPTVLNLVPILLTDIPFLIPNPAVAGLVTAIITLIADLYRRKAAGKVIDVTAFTVGSSSQ